MDLAIESAHKNVQCTNSCAFEKKIKYLKKS